MGNLGELLFMFVLAFLLFVAGIAVIVGVFRKRSSFFIRRHPFPARFGFLNYGRLTMWLPTVHKYFGVKGIKIFWLMWAGSWIVTSVALVVIFWMKYKGVV